MASSEQKVPGKLKSVFVISPIGKLDADGNDFAKLCLEQIIRPAAKDCGGYAVPERADEHHKPGSVTAKVVTAILDADVCVADLTERNANVMYEVAIAHAANKPVILLQQEPGGPPFDFADERVIHYGLRVDQANTAREELVGHFKAARDEQEDPRLAATMNPVRLLFGQLKASAVASEPEQAVLFELQALRDEILGVQRFLSSPAKYMSTKVPKSSRDSELLVIAEEAMLRGHLPERSFTHLVAGSRYLSGRQEQELRKGLQELAHSPSSEAAMLVDSIIRDLPPF
ncbi:MAG: nucleoside 2-deoxyribosyltransferase [Propionicimonas sp.]